LEQALPCLEQCYERRKATLGIRHLSTLTSLSNLATTYWQLKQLDKSVPLFESVLAGQEAILGRDHPDTLLTVGNLGVNLRDAGRGAEGLPLLQEAYRASQVHPRLRWIGFPLLETYQRQGELEQAAEMVAEILPEARRQLPPNSLPLSAQLVKLGQLLLDARRPEQAGPLLEECWQIRQQHQPDAWSSHFVRALLGTALLQQEKFAEAETHLVAGYEGMIATQTGVPETAATRAAEFLERLIELYEATGNPTQAEKYRQHRE
jgi:tetratricopeptide (TPR) repeat protein